MGDIIENDYSLTPGRYVGFSIQIDDNFDYKSRMKEIHEELSKKKIQSDELMRAIQRLKL